MNRGQIVNLPLSRFIGKTPVYMIKAMEGKLAKISEKIRDKSRTKRDVTNEYDTAIEYILRNIAEGVLPWNTGSPFKISYIDNIRPEYSGTQIWNTYEIGPDASRTYFTIKKLAEVCGGPKLRATGIDPSSYICLIVAETDKKDQRAVMTQLSNASQQYLRDRRRRGNR